MNADDKFWTIADEYARKLADANQVEQAWALRGMVDAVTGKGKDEGVGARHEYRKEYLRGFAAGSE